MIAAYTFDIRKLMRFWFIATLFLLVSCAGGTEQGTVEESASDVDIEQVAETEPTAALPERENSAETSDPQKANPTQIPTNTPGPTPEPLTLETELVAHYLFDGSADDVSGNSNHGQLNGDPAFTTDRFGNPDGAFQLDGVDDYIAIAHDTSYAPTSRLTLSTWFFYEPQPSSSTYYTIMEKSDPERGGHSRWGFWTIGNQAEFCIQPTSVQFQYCLDTVDGLLENGWNHIVGSWDTQNQALYLNGVLQVAQTYSRDGISSTAFDLFIGTDLYNDTVLYTVGAIDDVRIYRRGLSAEEVARLYALESDGMGASEVVEEVGEVEEAVVPVDERVEIAGVDGLRIVGDLRSDGGSPQPAVLLLHMLNNRRQSWDPLVPELLAAGYTVLAIDMRGHGETGGSMDWSLAEEDLRLVFDWLQARPEVDADHVAVIGASIGANMALRTGVNDAAAAAVIMLSGGLDYRGVTTDDALVAYGDRPVLIVAAEGDGYAANSAETLHAQQAELGNSQLIIYDGSAHGTSLFAAQPGIIPTLVEWLDQTIR